MESYSVCLFVTGLFHWAWCPQGSSMWQHVLEFPSFLKPNAIPLYGWTTFCLSHSSINGHSGCFHVLAIVNNAALNTGVQVSLLNYMSLQASGSIKCDNVYEGHGSPPTYTRVHTRDVTDCVTFLLASPFYWHLIAQHSNGCQHCDLLFWFIYINPMIFNI